jgi:hypothetical protein
MPCSNNPQPSGCGNTSAGQLLYASPAPGSLVWSEGDYGNRGCERFVVDVRATLPSPLGYFKYQGRVLEDTQLDMAACENVQLAVSAYSWLPGLARWEQIEDATVPAIWNGTACHIESPVWQTTREIVRVAVGLTSNGQKLTQPQVGVQAVQY